MKKEYDPDVIYVSSCCNAEPEQHTTTAYNGCDYDYDDKETGLCPECSEECEYVEKIQTNK